MVTSFPLPDNQAYQGAASLNSGASDFNAMDFVVRQIMGKMATATLVQVTDVHSAGEIAAAGFVDIHPMVAQIDGKGNATPHGTIHNVPYIRIQGGANAVIIDPAVGDIGIAIFAGQDISSAKVNKAPSNPGSRRRFDMADALYVGGVLNGVPTQYVRFSADGIELKPIATVTITGDLHVTGTATADTDVIGGGKSLKSHTHSGVTTGSGNTGAPV